MEPSDLRLLRGAREKIARLSALGGEPEAVELANTIGLVVDELIKRQQLGFFADSCASGDRILAMAAGRSDLPPSLAASLAARSSVAAAPDARTLRSTFRDLYVLFSDLVDFLAARADAGARRLLEEIVTWEAELVGSQPNASTPAGASEVSEISQQALEQYLRAHVPQWREATVVNFRRLPGGYSKVTTLFDVSLPGGAQKSFVLRAAQHGTPFFMDGADIACEYPALRYAFERDLPVAEPIHVETDTGRLGTKFLISRRAAGRNYGSVISSSTELSEELIRHLVAVLARVHATPLDPSDPWFRRSHLAKWARYPTLAEFTPAYIEYWTGIARQCGALTSPAIRRGLAWLRANPPVSEASPVLIHGDFGLHNTMIEAGRVSAVLDWEASHVGDPADEFFLFSHAVGGLVDRPTLMRWYEEAGGQRISPYRLRYFDVINCLKGPIVGYGALNIAEQNPSSDIKICLIGFQYVALQLQSLNAVIDLAEAARHEEPGAS